MIENNNGEIISSNVNFEFNQIFTGLEAFTGNLQLKLQSILTNLPVFFLQTGDTSYMMEKKFVETSNKEIYLKNPRVVLKINEIQQQKEQNTNYNNIFTFIKNEEEFFANGRRTAHLVTLDLDFVTSNFENSLQTYEILTTLFSRPNVGTFEFLGKNYDFGYDSISISMEQPSMDINNQIPKFVTKVVVEIQLQIITLKLETITEKSKYGFNKINYDLTVMDTDKTIAHQENLLITK